MREYSVNNEQRWTTHPRRIAADTLHQGRPFIHNGQYVFEITENERYSARRSKDGWHVEVDITGGRGQIINLYELYPEATGLQLGLAKILDRFDRTRLGKWWNGVQ